jgi:hypothetical protein
MFNKKIKSRVERLASTVNDHRSSARDEYWSLRHDIDRLVEALGMTKQETHKIEYVKKGGPERE